MSAPETFTPEQEAIRGQIDAIRADAAHPVNNPGHRLHEQEHEKVLGLYRQLHGGPATVGAEAPAEDAPPPPRPNVFDDPYAAPTTAAELGAVPLPAGLDPVMSQAVNVLAEREGVTAFVLEGRHVIAEALSGPLVDAVTAERQLQQRWGSMFPSKLEAAHLAFDALPDAVRADLERRELDVHPAVLDYLARVGEAMMDASTPGGERRLKAKYQESQ
jgi:hypothetical protein